MNPSNCEANGLHQMKGASITNSMSAIVRAFPIRGILFTCEIEPAKASTRQTNSTPETIERCAPGRGSQATLFASTVKNDCATRNNDASCCYSFEQRKTSNQLLTVEEFRHAPTDAKRLVGVISLAAVVGGPHPHHR
jgi:hypothetical protein